MGKRKTHEEFVQQVYDLVGEEYIVKDKYVNYSTKINLTHATCGNDYLVSPDKFIDKGSRCKFCNIKNKTKTTEKFKQEVYELVGNEYEVLSDYKTTHKKIKMQHKKCSYFYEVRPSGFLSGRRCPKCFGNTKRSTEVFKKEVYDLVKDEYEVLGEYVNVDTHLEMRHVKCNSIYEVTPYCFIKYKSRCPKCNKGMKINASIFKSIIYELEGDDYLLLSEYINDREHVLLKHSTCSQTYHVSPGNFLSGKRCPHCRSSKGEQSISKWLNRMGIPNIPQYKFPDCKDKSVLSFDFAILDSEDNLVSLVEYDGIQHFEPVDVFGGRENYEDVVRKDQIKNNYCKVNDISLLRIPYWDFEHIGEILSVNLNCK